MKSKLIGLLVFTLITTTQCVAQRQIKVEAQNNDISNNLDLKAVATAFGESKNLEEFEQKLNDYDSGISNLDLNNDGQVDYLRVVEETEKNVHVVLIQAVLEKDVYQDVASIVVEKEYSNNNTTVQVIGDPYLYGTNYIIEPAYIYTPAIYSCFWGANYYSWHSPYYWGYYPTYYHHRSPFELNIYMSNVYRYTNHNHRYYYSNSIRNDYAVKLRTSISRNDYATRYPDRNFSSRNENVRNKRDFEFSKTDHNVRPNYQQSSGDLNRSSRTNENTNRNSPSNGWNQRNTNTNSRTYTQPTDSRLNTNSRPGSFNNHSNNEPVNRGNNSWNNSRNSENNSHNVTPTTPNRNTETNRNSYQPRQNNENSNSTRTSPNVSTPRTSPNVSTPRTSPQVSTPRTSSPSTTPVVKESRRESNNDKKDNRR